MFLRIVIILKDKKSKSIFLVAPKYNNLIFLFKIVRVYYYNCTIDNFKKDFYFLFKQTIYRDFNNR